MIGKYATASLAFKVDRYSQRSGSNRRPAVYETAALPLSYAGTMFGYSSMIIAKNDLSQMLEAR